MKYIMYVIGVLAILLLGITAFAKVTTIRVGDIGWEVGKVGKTIDVYKFEDGKATCYVAQKVTQYSDYIDISCVK